MRINSITHYWYSKNLIAYSLLPLSWFYRGIVALRRCLYRIGLKKTTNFSVPVIVVGNITVGGTGKTPLVIWLAHFLQAQGYQPGIVSRGYGSKSAKYPYWVTAQSEPIEVGDEPLLIVKNTRCPLVIDPNRPRAVTALLQKTNCNVVISDDGLQHYAMGRSIEIAVIDGQRRLGNGFCLPAGPLRESATRLNEVTFVVNNGGVAADEYSMLCIPGNFTQVINPAITAISAAFKQKIIYAVAGIGNPSRFFASLRALGLTIVECEFPDHFAYQAKDLAFPGAEIIIMTEKDAVKCQQFADERFWYLPIQAEMTADFGAQLLEKLRKTEL